MLGTAVADEDGHWRFTPDPLGEGEHRLSTTVTDVAGNTSGHSPDLKLAHGGHHPLLSRVRSATCR
ncbi:Ig-like domain-containing protein [Klebsiella pneumoniae]